MVVIRAAHILVIGRTPLSDGYREWGLLVEGCFEDRQHRATRRRADGQRAQAGSFEPGTAVLAFEREQPEAGAVAHLRVRLVGQQMLDDGFGTRTDRLAPVEQSARRPFHVRAVRGWHVLSDGRMFALEP